uniref:Chromo domain-containing protein LHP1c n=1 Tax=Chrysanthemum morifolium TaxID=41568 RepID=A0A343EXC9_CHRMO|nr:chromo domain-containing protein LHP1c [Chrysanthemum x morifolium]
MKSKRQTNTKTKTKTKSPDLEQQQQPPAQNDETDVGNEYDAMYGEDYEYYEEEELEKPKLAEGFYEIEAVRKKRVRKGKTEYLVKWLGWPESGNSWEPVENLDSVTDFIEAYEESLKSGKRRSNKKGKRKNQNLSPDATYAVPTMNLNITEEPLQVPSVHNSNFSNGTDNNVIGTDLIATVNQPNETQSVMGSPQAEETKKTKDLDVELSEVRATTSSTNQENKTELAVHIQEDVGTEDVSPENGVSKDGEMVLTRVSQRIGSKRRKTCAVKRFKQATNSAPTTDPVGKTTATSDVDGKDDIKNDVSVGNGLELDTVATPESAVIIKIVKPVNYTTSMQNGIEEVCVSLLVKRSDGEEVVVDNKYLKENNPVLLINYYEKHLRYYSPERAS